MPRNPQSTLHATFKDYNNESSTMNMTMFGFNIATFADQSVALGDLRDSLALMSGGAISNWNVNYFEEKLNPVLPADPNFQRERKWLVTMFDETSFATYRFEVPVARVFRASAPTDPLLVTGTEFADLTDPDVILFVDDVEQVYRTPEGNFGEVLSIQLIGKNL